MSKVYLAGPISGLSYAEARGGWRWEFAQLLPASIHCFSPMRAKDMLSNEQELSEFCYNEHPLTCAKGIITRDHNDVLNCDAIVANFLGAKRVSIGTCVEFGWASAYKKPIVLIIEDEGNPHLHAFITELAGYRTSSLEQAAQIVTHLLTSGV